VSDITFHFIIMSVDKLSNLMFDSLK